MAPGLPALEPVLEDERRPLEKSGKPEDPDTEPLAPAIVPGELLPEAPPELPEGMDGIPLDDEEPDDELEADGNELLLADDEPDDELDDGMDERDDEDEELDDGMDDGIEEEDDDDDDEDDDGMDEDDGMDGVDGIVVCV